MATITESVGRVLAGRYRIEAGIGTGASAHVYLATDVSLKRRVAVKVLHPALAGDSAFLRRFRAEAQAAASLTHPNLVAVYDWGETGGGPFLVLEFLAGGSLRQVLDAGVQLEADQVVRIGLQAAQGLAFAHTRGFVHRDVKPANLLFDGDGRRVCVADFGLARALAEAAWTEPVGATVGTARYAAPEQAQGRRVDGRADVYALGLVLYECLTGEVPFGTDTTIGTLMARVGATLPAHEALGVLEEVLVAATAPEPADRLGAAELGDWLGEIAMTLPTPDRLSPLGQWGAVAHGSAGDADPTEIAWQMAVAGPATGPAGAWAPVADPAADPAGAAAPPTDGAPTAPVGDGVTDDLPTPGKADELLAIASAVGVVEGGAPEAAPVGEGEGSPGSDAATDATEPPAAGPVPAGRHGRRRRSKGATEVAAAAAAAGGAATAETTAPLPPVPAGWLGPVPPTTPLVPAPQVHGAPPGPQATDDGRRRHRRWPWVVVVLALAAGATAGVLTYSAKKYKLFTPSRHVPALVGDDVSAAEHALAPAHFTLKVGGTQASIKAAKGTVLTQAPAPGRLLKEGSTVSVVLSSGPPILPVPFLAHVGGGCAAVTQTLSQAQFVTACVPEHSLTVPTGQVISWLPTGHALEGSTIHVVVSAGLPSVPVPDLAGDNQSEAVAALQAAHFHVGSVTSKPDADVRAGLVDTWSDEGQTVLYGTTIDIVLSSGPPMVAVPSLVGDTLAAAEQALASAGLTVGAVYGPPGQQRTVIAQSPENESVVVGSSVVLWVA